MICDWLYTSLSKRGSSAIFLVFSSVLSLKPMIPTPNWKPWGCLKYTYLLQKDEIMPPWLFFRYYTPLMTEPMILISSADMSYSFLIVWWKLFIITGTLIADSLISFVDTLQSFYKWLYTILSSINAWITSKSLYGSSNENFRRYFKCYYIYYVPLIWNTDFDGYNYCAQWSFKAVYSYK